MWLASTLRDGLESLLLLQAGEIRTPGRDAPKGPPGAGPRGELFQPLNGSRGSSFIAMFSQEDIS